MRDMTTSHFWCCTSRNGYHRKVTGSKGSCYTVTFGRVFGREYLFGWTCSCAGFKFGKQCKHVEETKRLAVLDGGFCGWHQFIDGGDAVESEGGHTCPECGAAVEAEAWAV